MSTAQVQCAQSDFHPLRDSLFVNAIHKKPITLNHHVFTNGNWKLKLAQPHPTVQLSVSTEKADYDRFGLDHPRFLKHSIKAIVDSGAQCCLWGLLDCLAAGFSQSNLIPVKQKLNAVSRIRINIYMELSY